MNDIAGRLHCPICHELYRTAMIIPHCSHNFCSVCIRRALDLEQKCPVCRVGPITIPDIKNNRLVDEIVALLKRTNEPSGSNKEGRIECPICLDFFTESEITLHAADCGEFSDKNRKKQKTGRFPINTLPKLCYPILSEKQLRKILQDLGLPSHGDKQQLIRRHSEYLLLHNSECDSLEPLSIPEIIEKVMLCERIKNTERKIVFNNQDDLKAHANLYKDDFKSLIQSAKQSMSSSGIKHEK